jgi:hypothetical protein
MATDIYSMLTGGYDPRAEQMKQQQAFQQQLGQSTTPQSFLATVGSNMGNMLGQGVQKIAGVKDPREEKERLKKEAMDEVQASGVNMSDQVAVLKAIMQALQKRGLSAEAMAIGAQMPKADKVPTSTLAKLLAEQKGYEAGTPQYKAYQKAIDKETASAADKEPSVGTKAYLKAIKVYKKPFNSLTMEEQAEVARLVEEDAKEAASKTGITLTLPGEEKVIDIPNFRAKVTTSVKPYKDAVDASDTVITAINLGIKEGNFAAAKGAATALVKAFGDGQISRLEAERAGADPSILGGGIDYINQLFTGTPSKDTMIKIRKTAEALKKLNKEKMEAELGVQRKIGILSKIPENVIDVLYTDYEQKKTVVRTGTLNGRKVVEYDDGSVDYAD